MDSTRPYDRTCATPDCPDPHAEAPLWLRLRRWMVPDGDPIPDVDFAALVDELWLLGIASPVAGRFGFESRLYALEDNGRSLSLRLAYLQAEAEAVAAKLATLTARVAELEAGRDRAPASYHPKGGRP